jgi:hypothetical protein
MRSFSFLVLASTASLVAGKPQLDTSLFTATAGCDVASLSAYNKCLLGVDAGSLDLTDENALCSANSVVYR